MAKKLWIKLWKEKLRSSTNYINLKITDKGIYFELYLIARDEDEYDGMICYPNGSPIPEREIAYTMNIKDVRLLKRGLQRLKEKGFIIIKENGVIEIRNYKELQRAAKDLPLPCQDLAMALPSPCQDSAILETQDKENKEDDVKIDAIDKEEEEDKEEEKNKYRSNRKELLNWFDKEFYPRYLKKVGKEEAIKAVKKLNPNDELQKLIIERLNILNEQDYKYREKKYIPHPATWLNQKLWTDEPIKQGEVINETDKRNIKRGYKELHGGDYTEYEKSAVVVNIDEPTGDDEVIIPEPV